MPPTSPPCDSGGTTQKRWRRWGVTSKFSNNYIEHGGPEPDIALPMRSSALIFTSADPASSAVRDAAFDQLAQATQSEFVNEQSQDWNDLLAEVKKKSGPRCAPKRAMQAVPAQHQQQPQLLASNSCTAWQPVVTARAPDCEKVYNPWVLIEADLAQIEEGRTICSVQPKCS